jgi:proteasome accessory factor A
MLNRVIGLETEYGCLINRENPRLSPEGFAHTLRDYLFQHQHLGLLDLHHRGYDEPPGNGGFILNAGRIYIDMGHLEYATPECATLLDIVTYDKAGDLILQRALEEMKREMNLEEGIALIKNNIDHETGATFGSHENYLVSRSFPFTQEGLGQLIPFLVTRQVFTGTGRIGAHNLLEDWSASDAPSTLDNVEPNARVIFQISQRADHIVNEFYQWVQFNRAIINTRDEPLADPNRYRRIHLLLGDSNMCEFATALKVGTTALVLQLIEEGHSPRNLTLQDPVLALKTISRDPQRRWLITLENGKSLSALDIQADYLNLAQRYLKGQDEETDWILREWERVLGDLQGDYQKLVGRVDWASKLWLLETFLESEGLSWDDPWLKGLDLEYHNLNPQEGLYFGLVEEGRATRCTTDTAIRLATETPPRNTRAFGRGDLIKYLLQNPSPYVINWSAFQLKGQSPFPMIDPFKTYVKEIRTLLKIPTENTGSTRHPL